MPNIRIVSDNAIERATLSASSSAGAAFPPANLANDLKANIWRGLSKAERLAATWTTPETIQAVALPYCNLSPTSQMRVRVSNEKSATNLLMNSERIGGTNWGTDSGAGATTGNAGLAPDGSFTATLLAKAAPTASYRYQAAVQRPAGKYTASVWVKKVAATPWIFVQMNNDQRIGFNLDTKAIIVSAQLAAPVTGAVLAEVGGWVRIGLTATLPAAWQQVFNIGLSNSTGHYSSSALYAFGEGHLFWGAMLNEGDPSSYYPSLDTFTSRASVGTYIGGDGLIKSAAANTPRMQYDPMNPFAPPRLLLEPAATNYVPYSELFTTGWTSGPARARVAKTFRGIPYTEITKTTSAYYEFIRSVTFARTAGGVQTLTLALRAGTSDKASVGLYVPTSPTWGNPAESVASIISGPGTIYGTGAVRDILGLSTTEDTVLQITRLHTASANDVGVLIYPGTSGSVTAGESILATRVQVEDGSAVYGPELVTNGTFDTNTTGWTATNATLSVVGGKLRVTGTSGSIGGVAEQSFSTVIGKLYEVVATCTSGSNNGYYTVGASSPFMIDTSSAAKQYFVATATTTKISMRNGGTAAVGAYAEYDNVTIREVTLVPVVTSYIPTTTAAVTRAADVYTSAPGVRPDGYVDHWQSYDYDSGWVLACPAPAAKVRRMSAAQAASAYAFGGGAFARHWLPAPVQARRLVVDVNDANNLQGFVEAAYLVAAPYFEAEKNADYGAEATPVDSTVVTRSGAGDLMPAQSTRSKKLKFSLSKMSPADRAYIWDVLRASGVGYPVWVSLFPEDADLALEATHQIWGYLEQLPSMTLPSFRVASATLSIQSA